MDEGAAPSSSVIERTNQAQAVVSNATEKRTHTVADFLSRPNKLSSIKWNSGQVAGTSLLTGPARIIVPNSLFARPMILEKITGFSFFRATTVFKVQVNTNPFQQGRLLAVFVPYGSKTHRHNTALEHFGGITGYPHVDLDISTSQTMTLRVPFASPLTHLNLIDGFGTVGELKLYVYGQLASGEDSEANITVWSWFEDVEMEIPSGHPINISLQSGEGSVSSNAAIDAALQFPWEKLAMLAVSAAEKPTITKTTESYQPMLARHFANASGLDTSKTISLAPNNFIEPFPGQFGSDKDEMDLSYVFQTPSYIDRFSWSTSQAADADLWVRGNHPMIVPMASNVASPSVLAYATAPFKYWTGALIYTFKFVKTNFHSGRVRVAFSPGSPALDTGTVNFDKCYTVILDLKEKSEFSIEVPYVNSTPWARTYPPGGSAWVNAAAASPSHIHLTVLNELIAPGITSNTIDCIVEISGGKDYKVAFPSYMGAIPFTSDPAGVPTGALTLYPKLINYQSGDVQTRDEQQERASAEELFFDAQGMSGLDADKHSIGEKVQSVKSLVQRFNLLDTRDLLSTRFDPYFANSTTDAAITDTNSRRWNDYYSWYSFLYAFQAGGMRMKLQYTNDKAAEAPVTIATLTPDVPVSTKIDEAQVDVTISPDQAFQAFPRVVHFPDKEGCVELEIPYYSQTLIRMTTGYAPLGDLIADPTWNRSPLPILSVKTQANANIFRAVADDFRFGYLVGPPQVVVTESAM